MINQYRKKQDIGFVECHFIFQNKKTNRNMLNCKGYDRKTKATLEWGEDKILRKSKKIANDFKKTIETGFVICYYNYNKSNCEAKNMFVI